MANPNTPTYRYDPFTKHFSHEVLDCKVLAERRRFVLNTHTTTTTTTHFNFIFIFFLNFFYCFRDAILSARKAKTVGIAFSTLGRQASKTTLSIIEKLIVSAGKESILVLLDDVSPQALANYKGIDVWVQMACPRLSLDWSTEGYTTPLLTTHEAMVAFSPSETDVDYFIPMDNWAHVDSHYRQYV